MSPVIEQSTLLIIALAPLLGSTGDVISDFRSIGGKSASHAQGR